MSIIVVLTTAGLLIGFLAWRHWTNQNALIGKEQAIELAVQAYNPDYGLQPVEPPTEIEAKLVQGGAERDPYSLDPTRPVWVVTMKGRWLLVGGPPRVDPNPQPSYENECVIKIDARTGETVSLPIE